MLYTQFIAFFFDYFEIAFIKTKKQQVDRYERDRRRDVHRLQIRGLGALVPVRKHSRLRRPNHLVLGASHPQQVDRECGQQTECKQFQGISNEVSSN